MLKNRLFKNKQGILNFIPQQIVCPETLEQLQEVVKNAKKVRAFGAAHSWGDFLYTEDTLIDTSKLNKIINYDENSGEITVECGCTLGEIVQYLKQYGRTLPSVIEVDSFRIGGVISIGSYFTGIPSEDICLSHYATEITVVNAAGELIKVDNSDQKMIFYRSALGFLGMIYSVKLQTIDDRLVQVHKEKISIANLAKFLKKTHDKNLMTFVILDSNQKEVITLTYEDVDLTKEIISTSKNNKILSKNNSFLASIVFSSAAYVYRLIASNPFYVTKFRKIQSWFENSVSSGETSFICHISDADTQMKAIYGGSQIEKYKFRCENIEVEVDYKNLEEFVEIFLNIEQRIGIPFAGRFRHMLKLSYIQPDKSLFHMSGNVLSLSTFVDMDVFDTGVLQFVANQIHKQFEHMQPRYHIGKRLPEIVLNSGYLTQGELMKQFKELCKQQDPDNKFGRDRLFRPKPD